MTNYRSLNHTKWACQYHVVFIPKFRKKVIYGELRRYLGEVLRRLAQHRESEVEEGHLMVDHVHIMLSISPKYSVAQVFGYMVPLRDRCSFGRFTWLISQALTVTYVVGEHRLYLERNCRLPESGPQETAESRGACQFQGAEQSAGFGPAVEPRRK